MKIYYCRTQNVLISPRRQYHAHPIDEEIMISILGMLGAMNKEIRNEIRCFFYWNMPLRLKGPWQADMDMHAIIHHFLDKIGPKGCISLPELDVIPYSGWDLDYGVTGVNHFHSMRNSIAICHSIRYFSLELAVTHLFTPDIERLKAIFLARPALDRSQPGCIL